MQTGLANAQMFNPALSSQGSIFGSFLSILGAVILFSLNMHHLLIASLVESYDMFPVGTIPDTGGMAQIVTYATTAAFAIGIKMAAPFFVLTLVLYVGMGILSRLMPQLQVFMVALPLQILLSFILVVFVLAAVMGYWSVQFEEGMVFFLKQF
jgi:flagellar biosynthetic protein FliR